MENGVIVQMIENTRLMLSILADSENRCRAELEADIRCLLVEYGLIESVRDLEAKADAKIKGLQENAESLRKNLAWLESMVTPVPAQTNYAHGLDLTQLDSSTASLVRMGHLPTITHLGGHIENAAQSEDYAVTLA